MALLRTENLTVYFGGLSAVNSISLEIGEGEIVGLIGPNGAGKTTLFNLITGFLSPSRGSVTFSDQSIQGKQPHTITHLGIARTFQIVRPFGDLSVLDNVAVAALNREKSATKAREKAMETLLFLEMADLAEIPAKNLTLGSRKRLELARALATRPRLLLLDEVMGGLNGTEIQEMLKILVRIHQSGITILIIEHIMSVIMSFSKRIVVMHHGEKLAEGTPGDIARMPQVLDAYLGEEYFLA
jgi:branched-chain amino acid transport system ATP-binding protein